MDGEAAVKEFYRELKEAGFPVTHVAQLAQTGEDYRAAVPILLKWRNLLPVDQKTAVLHTLGRSRVVSVIPALLEEFRSYDGDENVRWVAGVAVRSLWSDEYFDEMVTHATDRQHGRTRERLLEGLWKSRRPERLDVLFSQIDDPDVTYRVIVALGRIADPAARTVLEGFLTNEDPKVAGIARSALDRIAEKQGSKRGGPQLDIDVSAAKWPEVPALQPPKRRGLFGRKKPKVRDEVGADLEEMGRELSIAGFEHVDPYLLSETDDLSAAVPILIDWRNTVGPTLKQGVLIALGSSRDRSVLPVLLQEFTYGYHSDLMTRWFAGEAILKLWSDRYYDEIVSIATDRKHDHSRSSLLEGLAKSRKPGRVDVLISQIDDLSVTYDVMHTLGRIGDPKAIPALEAFLDHEDKELVTAANRALTTIAAKQRRAANKAAGNSGDALEVSDAVENEDED